MATSTEKAPLVIVGGGLAGLTLSIGLTRHGIPHQIYESAKEFSEIGAGVSLSPNSVGALELIDQRIADEMKKCITYNDGVEGDKEGEVNMENPTRRDWLDFRKGTAEGFGELITTVSARGDDYTGRSSFHRAKFLDELIKLIPENTAHFKKALVSITEPESKDPNEPLTLTFADGTTTTASAVIACDGIKSAARAQYVLADTTEKALLKPNPAHEFAYRGMWTREKFVEISKGAIDPGRGQIFMGDNTYIVMYPVEKGKLMNMVSIRIYSPEDKSINPPSPGESNWVRPVDHETMLADFASWGEPIRALLASIPKPERWFLHDHLPAPTYIKGRVALVGDSAHATTPHQGQGAGMAFEDSLILSQIMGHFYNNKPDAASLTPAEIQACFQAYDQIRRPRTKELVRSSREMGRMICWVLPETGRDLEKIKVKLAARMNWVWDVDLMDEVKKGIEIVNGLLGEGVSQGLKSSKI